jgi:hypothetical protein
MSKLYRIIAIIWRFLHQNPTAYITLLQMGIKKVLPQSHAEAEPYENINLVVQTELGTREFHLQMKYTHTNQNK